MVLRAMCGVCQPPFGRQGEDAAHSRGAPAVKVSSTVAPSPAAEPAFPEGSGVDRAGLILFTLAAIQFISIVDFTIVMPLGPLVGRLIDR